MNEVSDPATREWHLDKRIPLATVIALFAQAIALGWLASSMDSRISYLEKFVAEMNAIQTTSHVAERIAVIESNQKNFNTQMDKFDHKLDRIADKLNVSREK